MKIAALIPARWGSRRIPNKNIRPFAGRPLIEWAIAAAREFGNFSVVAVSTEDGRIANVAWDCGAFVIDRPVQYATDIAPDIMWVQHALQNVDCDAFAILRPTSPFRTADTIRRSIRRFLEVGIDCDSLRAVEAVRQSPYKMWRVLEKPNASNPTLWMTPLLEQGEGTPYHSRPNQTHPSVYVQNACIEVAWRSTVERTGTIAGTRIIPFFTEYPEGIDLNTEADWYEAERIAEQQLAVVGQFE